LMAREDVEVAGEVILIGGPRVMDRRGVDARTIGS